MDIGCWQSGDYPTRQRALTEARIDGFKLGVWLAGLVLPWTGLLFALRLVLAAD